MAAGTASSAEAATSVPAPSTTTGAESLFNLYGEEGLRSTVENAQRLLALFDAKWHKRVVQVLQTRHEMFQSSLSSSSGAATTTTTTTSTIPTSFVLPSSVDTKIVGAAMEAWTLHNGPRQEKLYGEDMQASLLHHLWCQDPDLKPLHDDYMSMTLRWTLNELMGSDTWRTDMKVRRQVDLDTYRTKMELTKKLKVYEIHSKQYDLDLKRAQDKQSVAQAEEDAKMAARLAAGHRISTRDRVTIPLNVETTKEAEAIVGYVGPTSKEDIDQLLNAKRTANRERVTPIGVDRYGNTYWASPSLNVQADTPVLLLVEHSRSGRLHTYKEEKDIQQLMTSLLAQVRCFVCSFVLVAVVVVVAAPPAVLDLLCCCCRSFFFSFFSFLFLFLFLFLFFFFSLLSSLFSLLSSFLCRERTSVNC